MGSLSSFFGTLHVIGADREPGSNRSVEFVKKLLPENRKRRSKRKRVTTLNIAKLTDFNSQTTMKPQAREIQQDIDQF